MPLVYQQNINPSTKIGVWHITEDEVFFARQVHLQRGIPNVHKRLQHLAGRLLLKELFPGFPHELIQIADTLKPFLPDEKYHFSISHCGDYAAAIVSTDYRVGMDIEMIHPKVANVQHKFLSSVELSLLTEESVGGENESSIRLLTLSWCIKESLFKWDGRGGIDFKKHLLIQKILQQGTGGYADCSFLKNTEIHLPVHFMFLEDHCISWVFRTP